MTVPGGTATVSGGRMAAAFVIADPAVTGLRALVVVRADLVEVDLADPVLAVLARGANLPD